MISKFSTSLIKSFSITYFGDAISIILLFSRCEAYIAIMFFKIRSKLLLHFCVMKYIIFKKSFIPLSGYVPNQRFNRGIEINNSSWIDHRTLYGEIKLYE